MFLRVLTEEKEKKKISETVSEKICLNTDLNQMMSNFPKHMNLLK